MDDGNLKDTALGDQTHPPPEPGFAGREAHCVRLNCDHLGRLLKPSPTPDVLKEGAHGGTRGSPVKASEATPKGKNPRLRLRGFQSLAAR